ncbi:MAG: nuclear transport factor 2 family protein [Candidatus Sulfotelmatobacter sp.]|jgi:ketosteroid isomerase-like protein
MRGKALVLAIVSMAWLWGWSQIDDDQARILNLENAWNRSVQTKDTAGLDMLLAPELVYVGIEGKLLSKAEYMASIQSQQEHPTRVVSESMKVHVFGAAAIVDGVYRENGMKKGKPYTLRARFIDMWVRRRDTWVCIASDGTVMEP